MIQTLTLPVPWDLKSVNVHLVELAEGYLLIDSGVATEECFRVLETALAERGVQWSDIKTLLLTHYHPDHIGLSWKILERSGARLMMHRADVDYLKELAKQNRVPCFEEAMRISGVPSEFATEIETALRAHREPFREHRPSQILEGGELIPIQGGTLEVIWTPGHTQGHVCVYWKAQKTLISGDHLLEKITPNIAWLPGQDMLAKYLASLELLLPYDVDAVLPSHGAKFANHELVVRSTLAHHAKRCEVILQQLSEQPMTAHELVLTLWKRRLSAFHHNFAVFEILAHLEYMRLQGKVSGRDGRGGATEWAPA